MIKINCDLHVSDLKGKIFEGQSKKCKLNLEGDYTFIYDYPLKTNAMFVHNMDGLLLQDLLLYASADYHRIYNEENAAVGDPGKVQGMLNRAHSYGPYGIFGHDIGDLCFETIYIDTENKTVSFDIGS